MFQSVMVPASVCSMRTETPLEQRSASVVFADLTSVGPAPVALDEIRPCKSPPAPGQRRCPGDAALATRRASLVFRDPRVETAFRRFQETWFSKRLCVSLFCAGQIIPAVLFGLYFSVRDGCRSCEDAVTLGIEAAALAVVALFGAVSLAVGGVITFTQEATYVVAMALHTAAVACPLACAEGESSSEGQGGGRTLAGDVLSGLTTAYVPTLFFPANLGICAGLWLVLFGTVVWPRVLLLVVPMTVVQLVAVLAFVLLRGEPVVMPVFFVVGLLTTLLVALLLAIERRNSFVAAVSLERERRQTSLDKTATEAIIATLFPKHVIPPLLEQRRDSRLLVDASRYNWTDTSHHNWTDTTAKAPPQRPRHSDLAADSYDVATVVFVSVGGVSDCPSQEDLAVLSRAFSAVERLAEELGIEKVKAVGATLVLAAGLTRAEGHEKKACEFATRLHGIERSLSEELHSEFGFRVGIACGPVSAGVVGISRPRYDAWGCTVSVAKRLMLAAGRGGQLSQYSFERSQCPVCIPGVGSIAAYQLQDSSSAVEEQLPASGDPSGLWSRTVVDASDVAASMPSLKEYLPDDPRNRITLRFCDSCLESRFADWYVVRYLPFHRWLSLLMVFSFSAFLLWRAFEGSVLHISLQALHVLLFFVIFGITWIPQLTRRTNSFFLALASATVACAVLHMCMWDCLVWRDAAMGGFIAMVSWLHFSKVPFFLVSPVSAAMVVLTVPLFVVHHYTLASAVTVVCFELMFQTMQYYLEWHVRDTYLTEAKTNERSQKNEQEREIVRDLLSSVVPLHVVDALRSGDSGAHLYRRIESGTVLTCGIVGFERIACSVPASRVARLLSNYFSRLDSVVAASGVDCVKADGDKYVVVGNLYNEMPQHASTIVAVAQQMAMQQLHLSDRNLRIRIGVHTGPLVTGVVRMKSLAFNCWGDAVEVAEEIVESEDECAIVVTSDTASQLGGAYSLEPRSPLCHKDRAIELFAVQGFVSACTDPQLYAQAVTGLEADASGAVPPQYDYGLCEDTELPVYTSSFVLTSVVDSPSPVATSRTRTADEYAQPPCSAPLYSVTSIEHTTKLNDTH
eukprot:m51a1_g11332 putative adenylate guanylate cyclase (1081) ;mRNA; r:135975-139899